jgi:RNA polymerase sigma-70 factor (ECF subfamily)
MHNVFINQLKARVSRPPETVLDDMTVEPATRGEQSDRLEVRDLNSALNHLPIEQREVLLLVTLEELSYEETARILDVPVGTVMSRLSRARDRLRQLLDGNAAPVTLQVVK